MPTAQGEQDNFLLYVDSGKIAKRYKSFERAQPRTQKYASATSFPSLPLVDEPISRETTEKKDSESTTSHNTPLQPGETYNIPFQECTGPEDTWKVKYYRNTLLNRTRNEAGLEGFLVKFHGYPEPEFVDCSSLLECRI